VRSAIGFDAERGDSVDVKNMPFVQPKLEEIESSIFDLTKNDIFRLIELGVLVLLAVLAIFMVVRPTLAKLMPEPVTLDPSMAASGAAGDGSNLPAVLDENGQPILDGTAGGGASDDGSGELSEGSDEEKAGMLDFDDKVTSGLVQQIQNVIEARPDDAVSVVRLWMEEGSEVSNG